MRLFNPTFNDFPLCFPVPTLACYPRSHPVCAFPKALCWWRGRQATIRQVFRVFLIMPGTSGKGPRDPPTVSPRGLPGTLWLSSRCRWRSSTRRPPGTPSRSGRGARASGFRRRAPRAFPDAAPPTAPPPNRAASSRRAAPARPAACRTPGSHPRSACGFVCVRVCVFPFDGQAALTSEDSRWHCPK